MSASRCLGAATILAMSYVEDCTNMSACRYLLVGIVPIAGAAPLRP